VYGTMVSIMLPILIDFGFIRIYTMGVFMALSFFIGAFWLWKTIKLTAFKEEDIFDGLFISMIGGLFFSRLLYVLFNFNKFGFNLLKFILINGYPGLSLFGGLVGGLATFYVFCRYRKINFWEIVDYVATPLFFALAIGKVGSFLSGSDIGTQTHFFLRTYYIGYEGGRHLTALYEAVLFSLGALFSYRMLFKVRRNRSEEGTPFLYFLVYFSGIQIILDNLKENHLYFAGLSFNLIGGIIIFLITTGYLIYIYRNKIRHILQTLQIRKREHVKK